MRHPNEIQVARRGEATGLPIADNPWVWVEAQWRGPAHLDALRVQAERQTAKADNA